LINLKDLTATQGD